MKPLFYLLLLGLITLGSCIENPVVEESHKSESEIIPEVQSGDYELWNASIVSHINELHEGGASTSGPGLLPLCKLNWYRFVGKWNGCCVYEIPSGKSFLVYVDGVPILDGATMITVCEDEEPLVEVRWYDGAIVLCSTTLECTCCQEVTATINSTYISEMCCLIVVDYNLPNCMASNNFYFHGRQIVNGGSTVFTESWNPLSQQYTLEACSDEADLDEYYVNFFLNNLTLSCRFESGFYRVNDCVVSSF